LEQTKIAIDFQVTGLHKLGDKLESISKAFFLQSVYPSIK